MDKQTLIDSWFTKRIQVQNAAALGRFGPLTAMGLALILLVPQILVPFFRAARHGGTGWDVNTYVLIFFLVAFIVFSIWAVVSSSKEITRLSGEIETVESDIRKIDPEWQRPRSFGKTFFSESELL